MRDLSTDLYLSHMCGPLHPHIRVDSATDKPAIEEYRSTNKKRYHNRQPSHEISETNSSTRKTTNIISISKTKEDKKINTEINSVGVTISDAHSSTDINSVGVTISDAHSSTEINSVKATIIASN
jgi:hypothetical protein